MVATILNGSKPALTAGVPREPGPISSVSALGLWDGTGTMAASYLLRDNRTGDVFYAETPHLAEAAVTADRARRRQPCEYTEQGRPGEEPAYSVYDLSGLGEAGVVKAPPVMNLFRRS